LKQVKGAGKGSSVMSNLDREKLTDSPIHGWIDGPRSRPIKVDKWTRSLITMSNREHQINRGYEFVTTASTMVNAGGKLDVLIKTNINRPNMVIEFETSTAAILFTYLPSPRDYNPDGALVKLNRNFEPTKPVSGISICTNALTTGATETHIRKVYLGSATGPGGQFSTGGQTDIQMLFYLNNTILLELVSTTDDNALNMRFHWSEGVPYDSGLDVPVDPGA